MYVVIAMAGEGRRFRERGFDRPKYELMVKGRPMFDWALESLRAYFTNADFIFITRPGAEDFVQERARTMGIMHAQVVELLEPTDGQATTVLKGIEGITDTHRALLIYNIDTHVMPHVVRPEDIRDDMDGWVLLFPAEGSHWSFAKLDDQGVVTAVSEKVRISDYGTVGLYYFKSADLFRQIHASHAQATKAQYREVYVMPLYQALLDKKMVIGSKIIDPNEVVPLGTPDEVLRFDPDFEKQLLE